jgi:hypothetical protein
MKQSQHEIKYELQQAYIYLSYQVNQLNLLRAFLQELFYSKKAKKNINFIWRLRQFNI